MIDLHCHLLPGIDDGPATLVDAMAMAQGLVDSGVTVVAATPHVAPEYPNTASIVTAAHAAVADEIAARGIPLEVVCGAEVDLVHIQDFSDAELVPLALGSGGTLLVECPFAAVAPFFERSVAAVQARGLRVLLAHPERSPAFLREPALLERLVASGALASLTAASFAGRFGRQARQYAGWAMERGCVHDVASDAHDVDRRPPGLREPLEAAGFGWAADWLTDVAPAAILAGAPLPARPAAPAPGMRFPRLRRR